MECVGSVPLYQYIVSHFTNSARKFWFWVNVFLVIHPVFLVSLFCSST